MNDCEEQDSRAGDRHTFHTRLWRTLKECNIHPYFSCSPSVLIQNVRSNANNSKASEVGSPFINFGRFDQIPYRGTVSLRRRNFSSQAHLIKNVCKNDTIFLVSLHQNRLWLGINLDCIMRPVTQKEHLWCRCALLPQLYFFLYF